MNLGFNPMGFIETLPYMGKGMLGIFLVILIIYFVTWSLQKIFK